MRLMVVLLNFFLLVFFTYWIVTGVYDGLKHGMSKHHDFFNFGFIDYSILISLSILLPLLNILINVGKVKNRFLFYLTILKNFLIVLFCSLMMFFIIYDELNEDLNEWEKIFNPIDYEVITGIFCVGILLPSVCIYLIYYNHIKCKFID